MGYFGIPFRNGVPIGLGSVVSFGAQQFDPSELFVGGTAGAWYDPSDLTTLFTTSAGTTPVAMPGQGAPVPVGAMLDKRAAGYSVFFDGTGDYLSVPDSAEFDFAAGEWTVEAWFYRTNNVAATSAPIFAQSVSGAASNSATYFGAGNDGVAIYLSTSGTSWTNFMTSSTAPAQNTWAHIVWQRRGNTLEIYLNGVSQAASGGSSSFSGTVFNSSRAVEVGAQAGSGSTAGYISNLRVVKGAAVYTGNFTPPTSPLSPITGTSLLTCGTTWSGNPAITTVGNTRVDGLNPFTASPVGNHAIAFNNTTARPELRARVNLLERSEEFSNAYWFSTDTVRTSGQAAPNGTLTAFRIDFLNNTGARINTALQVSVSASTEYKLSVYAKAFSASDVGKRTTLYVFDSGSASRKIAAAITLTADWVQYSGTITTASNTNQMFWVVGSETGVNDVCSAVLWGADLRPANIGANVPAYQRIADALTYDTSGFPLYLLFEGAVGQRGMYTPASIPFATVTSDGQARRNLLSFPTVFNDPFWTVSGTTVSANSTTAPDGTTTADTLTETAAAGSHQIYNTSQLLGVPTPLCMSVYVKPNGRTWVFLGDDGGGVFFNLAGAGSVGTQQAGRTGSISSVGDGWYRVVVTGNRPAVNDSVYIALCSADNTLSYTGNGTSGVFIWGAQFESGSTATAFQNIGTDKVAVFAGVRKLSDAAQNIIAELSVNRGTNNGSWTLLSPNASNNSYAYISKGTIEAGALAGVAQFPAPDTRVITGLGDISGDVSQLRLNGTVIQTTTTDQGTGNYGTYPLFIGARNNASSWLNGQIYSLIIAGSAVSAGNISATESWVAGKVGIQI